MPMGSAGDTFKKSNILNYGHQYDRKLHRLFEQSYKGIRQGNSIRSSIRLSLRLKIQSKFFLSYASKATLIYQISHSILVNLHNEYLYGYK